MRFALFLFFLALGLLCLANFRATRSYFKVLDDFTDAFMVRQEMKRIAEVVYQDYISDQPFPGGSFAEYLRTNMQRQTRTPRDLAKDHWGNEYQLRIADDRRSFSIYSAGPDRKYATRDDLRVERQVAKPSTQPSLAGQPATPGARQTRQTRHPLDQVLRNRNPLVAARPGMAWLSA